MEIEPSVVETALLTCAHLRIIELLMFFLHSTLFILLLFSTHCFAGQNTILVLGDSLSAAHGIDVEQGWVSLLQSRLNQKYNGESTWKVINASVSGETTSGGLAKLPDLLEKYKPDLCIIGLGANNGLRGQPPTMMRDHLALMINYCKNSGTSLLLGMKLPPNYGKKYTNEFNNSYATIAKSYNVAYVPFFLEGVVLNNDLMQIDGLHPNAKAQPIILENVWPTLYQLLRSISS